MRSVVFLLMLIPLAIGNSAFAETYTNDDYSFSITYPDKWIFNDEIVIYEDGRTTTIEFWDSVDGWVTNVRIDTNVQIANIEESETSTKDHNANVFDLLKNKLETSCKNNSKAIEGFTCSNFKLLEFRILMIDEIKSYQLTYSWTESYSEKEIYKNISLYTVIPKDETTWIISSQTLAENFPEQGVAIQDMIKSFQPSYTKIVEEEFETTLTDEEQNSFVGLIITTMNSMLNMAFGLEDDPTLQGWANDVISNVAGRTEAKIANQLGYDPTSFEEVREHFNGKPNPKNLQQKELPEIKPTRKALPIPEIIPEPERKPLLSSQPKTIPNYELPVEEVEPYHKTITYTYAGLPSSIDKMLVFDAIAQAFRNWDEINPYLEFEYSENAKPDIVIKWQAYSNPNHDGLATITFVNGKPITGKGTITAALGSVDCNGEFIQFSYGRTTNILMHEIGHVMGLEHHMDENHLMYDPNFIALTEYDDLELEIPKRLDDWFVGQADLVAQDEALKKEYDSIYDQYKKYEGKPIPASEYTTAISLYSQLNEISDEHNKVLEKLDCYPNFTVIDP